MSNMGVALVTLISLLFAILAVGVTLAGMIRSDAKARREDLREFQKYMDRLRDRITDTEINLRERMAWIQSLVGMPPDSPGTRPVYRWRRISDSVEED